MEFRLRNLLKTLALAPASVLSLAVLIFAHSASASLVCETAFVDQRQNQNALDDEIERAIELTRNLLYVDEDGTLIVSRDPSVVNALRHTAEVSLDLIRFAGTDAKLIEFEGLPAVEFIPHARASSGWNRMASSLLKNYGTRLIYAPHYLHSIRAKSAWQESTRTILVSRESLREGRSERNNLQEFGHMKSALTKDQSPNVFSGFFEIAEPGQTLVPGAIEYATSMELDEVVRYAQDLNHLGLALIRRTNHGLNQSSDRDIPSPTTSIASDRSKSSDASATSAVRSELKAVAKRGREIIAIAQASVDYHRAIAKSVRSKILGSGPLLLADGSTDSSRAYIAAAKDVQVTIEHKTTGTLRFRIEDTQRSSEIWIRGGAFWSQLVSQLQMNDSRAHVEFQKRFSSLVQEWENGLTPSLKALRASTDVILEQQVSMSAAELSEVARGPRRIVAPLLRRTAP